jgi:hypothetical protein
MAWWLDMEMLHTRLQDVYLCLDIGAVCLVVVYWSNDCTYLEEVLVATLDVLAYVDSFCSPFAMSGCGGRRK